MNGVAAWDVDDGLLWYTEVKDRIRELSELRQECCFCERGGYAFYALVARYNSNTMNRSSK